MKRGGGGRVKEFGVEIQTPIPTYEYCSGELRPPPTLEAAEKNHFHLTKTQVSLVAIGYALLF